MTDYGHPISFGVSIDPDIAEFAKSQQLALAAEAAGLDLVAIQDHPYQPQHVDALTAATFLAAGTERIGVFTDVADLQLRSPVMLAKAAASLAALTGGRFDLGVGGGGLPDAIRTMGVPPKTPGQVVAYTEESMQVIRQALDGGTVRFAGAQLVVPGYAAGPVPPRRVGLWLGAQRPRLLAVVGRAADGWISPLNIYIPPREVPSRQRIIDEAAVAAGRSPSDVRRIYNVIGTIGGRGEGPGLSMSADDWARTLASWAIELGFDTFVFWPVTDHLTQLGMFAAEIVPAVRELVEHARNSSVKVR
ncbi:LLM class flavin-dependent oxidoreductase [Rhodococcus opacus]|uniref:LLM class flavin-dependent oxidoreductase n=1 Tax=Rhodococcus opacus TaxID=37919 RepID=UPI0024BAA796|nr:LLM class flavin-dependent oxidoreductase [Rhodococcus opacus]MDJ0420020.1 LLM class flavin-dependent oxidoreductase [Rhodococcus opacus]